MAILIKVVENPAFPAANLQNASPFKQSNQRQGTLLDKWQTATSKNYCWLAFDRKKVFLLPPPLQDNKQPDRPQLSCLL
jgi:hypothetical protein